MECLRFKLKYKAQDEIAITTMTLSMQDQILNHVMHLKNAKDIWDHLKNKNNRADTYSITALRRSLYVSTKGTKDIAKFLSEIKSIRNQLANINVVISDAEMICVTLNGLPNEYSNFTSMMDNVQNLTFDILEQRLLTEETRISNQLKSQAIRSYLERNPNILFKKPKPSTINYRPMLILFNGHIHLNICRRHYYHFQHHKYQENETRYR